MREQAAKGAVWVLIDTAGGQLISFIAFLILARLLLPAEYGIITLAAALVAVPSILVNEGFSEALVQRDDLTDDHINAAFWANIALAALFVILIQAIAGFAAVLTGKPIVEPVLRWLSLTLIMVSLVAIATGIYRRNLKYSTFALRTFIAITTGSAVAIVMAALGYGVWALVSMQLVSGIVGAVVLWAGIGWRPKLTYSVAAIRELYHFASRLMVANALRFASEKSDAIIIGIFLDAKVLGFYYLITRLLTTVNMVTLSPIDQVMMPVLSRMQGDKERLGDIYVNMLWAAAALWMPAVAGLGIISPLVLPLLFGSQWEGAVPMMVIVGLVAITYPIIRTTQHVFVAVGQPSTFGRLYFIEFIFVIIAFSIGVRFGGVGAACALVFTSFAVVPFHLFFLRRIIGLPLARMLSRYLRVVAASVIMAFGIWLIARWVESAAAWKSLIAEIGVGVVVYPLALYCLARADVTQLIDTAYGALRPRTAK